MGLGLSGPVPSPHLGSIGLGTCQAHGSRAVASVGLLAPPTHAGFQDGSGTPLRGSRKPRSCRLGKGHWDPGNPQKTQTKQKLTCSMRGMSQAVGGMMVGQV